MTRNPSSPKAEELAVLGAELVQADLDDEASLRSALEGKLGVYAVQNTWEAGVEGEEEQGKRLARLAKEAGVQHFVYASVGSADQATGIPHFDNKYRIKETVRELGFPSYVILRPAFFMENWTSPFFKPGVDDGAVAIAVLPDTQIQMVSGGHRRVRQDGLRAAPGTERPGNRLCWRRNDPPSVGHDA